MRKIVFISILGTAFLAADGTGHAYAGGKEVFEAKKCGGCHYTQGPAREKTIADQKAKKGPELWYAGSKFQKAWLEAWLQDPKPIRPLKYNVLAEKNPGDHLKLSGDEAKGVAEFLMALTSADVKAGSITPKENDPKAKKIFTKDMPCSGCHQYPDRGGKTAGGISGPSLAGASRRLNPDWILAYLQKPEIFKPVKAMPVFTGYISDKDMEKLAAWVAAFE